MEKNQPSTRKHLFEFNDSAFIPAFLRDSVVEILGRTTTRSGFYNPLLPVFKQFCIDAKCTEILDLCSGSGEPIATLLTSLRDNGQTDIQFHLSDLYPQEFSACAAIKAFPDNTSYTQSPINALDIGDKPEHQARTLIAAFHHFRPEQAQAVLASTVQANKAIFIIEPFPRRIRTTLVFFIKSFIPGMLNPINSRKDKLLKLLFTTLIPIIPIAGWWDTVVSVLRMYSKDECMEMVEDFTHYHWEFHELPIAMGGAITVFTGIPNG